MSGFLRVVPASHSCSPPNPWIIRGRNAPRLRYGAGTVWQCECGQKWVIPLTFSGRGWERMG